MLLATLPWVFWDHYLFFWEFDSLGPNAQGFRADTAFTAAMVAGGRYRYVCDIASWVRVGVTGAGGDAAIGVADSHYVPADLPFWIENPDTDITTNAFVHAIRVGGANGTASLSLYERTG